MTETTEHIKQIIPAVGWVVAHTQDDFPYYNLWEVTSFALVDEIETDYDGNSETYQKVVPLVWATSGEGNSDPTIDVNFIGLFYRPEYRGYYEDNKYDQQIANLAKQKLGEANAQV